VGSVTTAALRGTKHRHTHTHTHTVSTYIKKKMYALCSSQFSSFLSLSFSHCQFAFCSIYSNALTSFWANISLSTQYTYSIYIPFVVVVVAVHFGRKPMSILFLATWLSSHTNCSCYQRQDMQIQIHIHIYTECYICIC